MPKVLIVDDEVDMAETCARLLRPLRLDCTILADGVDAVQLIQQENFDLVLTDLRMPHSSGMDLVKAAQQCPRPPLVIMITGYGSIDSAVEAIKNGAFDFLTKPYTGDQLRVCVERALREISLKEENENLKQQLRVAYPMENIIGSSPAMQEAYALVRKIAHTAVSVLILGESGTGKEMFARAIHACSNRVSRSFIPIDCAALPEHLLESELFGYEKGAFTGAGQTKPGLLELAQGGTLFLDELGELGLGLQAKLLRVLQERSLRRVGGKQWIDIDVRVIAATNLDLTKAIKEKRFREDLYYRLNVVTLRLPPLRERLEDIPVLAGEFLRQANTQMVRSVREITPAAWQGLKAFSWPGNVRQLKNAVEHAVVLSESDVLMLEDFPAEIREAELVEMESRALSGVTTDLTCSGVGMDTTEIALAGKSQDQAILQNLEGSYHEAKERWLWYFQKAYLRQLLTQTRGNVSKAAKIAQIDRRTIHRWLKEED